MKTMSSQITTVVKETMGGGMAQRIYARLIDWVTSHPRTTFLCLVILIMAVSMGAMRLEIDDNLEAMLPDNTPSRILQRKIRDTFGRRDDVFIAIQGRTGSIFSPEDLEAMRTLAMAIEELPEVDRVRALSRMDRISGSEGMIEVLPVAPGSIKTAADAAALRERIIGDRLLRPIFLSDTEELGALIVTPDPDFDAKVLMAGIYAKVAEVFPSQRVFITGNPMIDAQASTFIVRDLLLLTPGVALMLAFIILMALRSMRGVGMALTIIGLSVCATVGLMGWCGVPFRTISSAIPIFVLATACADSMHILTEYSLRRSRGTGIRLAACDSMVSLFSPVTLTSLTTAAAFLTFIGGPLPALAQFGIFVGVGVMWAWMLSLFLGPALLVLFDPVDARARRDNGAVFRPSLFSALLESLAHATSTRAGWFFIGTIGLVALLSLGITRLTVESSPETFFDEGSDVIRGIRMVDEHFGGSRDITIVVDGDIKSPMVLKSMLNLQSAIESDSSVGSTLSIANIVQRLNQVVNDDAEDQYRVPDHRNAVAQELLLYSMSDNDLEEFVSFDYTSALIMARMQALSAEEMGAVFARIREQIRRYSDGLFRADLTGGGIFSSELAEMIVRSSLTSLFASIVVVYLISLLAIRSFRLALLSIVPLTAGIVLVFGFMGACGITLNLATALISCIVVGVGIDYSVHVIARYQVFATTRTREFAASEAIRAVGRPILFNGFAVALGFSVLFLSGFTPIKHLGILAVFAMLATMAGALTLLPALLSRFGGHKGSPTQK
jgi:hypothetical protein